MNLPLPSPVFSLPVLPYKMPPLALIPALATNLPNVRIRQFRDSGVTVAEALARAQGTTDTASEVVVAEGELDALRYGSILEARGLVGVRGAGFTHDGNYYVKRVKHLIKRGSYKQQFTLIREGTGALLPVVIP